MNNSERKSKTRRDILEAAREIFYREDYMGANVDEIAAAAKISKGAVYRYFTNKATLYVTVLGEDSRDFFAGVERRAAETKDLHTADRIRTFWSDYVEHWLNNPDAFRIFWAIDNEAIIGELPADLTERIAQSWKKSLEITQAVLEEGIRRGELIPIDTWHVTQAFWTLAAALIDQDNIRGRRKIRGGPFREVFDFSIELLLRGVLSDPADSRLPARLAAPIGPPQTKD
ncbi:MAG: TetR/AcrR family transcriptional regulator [bacterium]|nr:hypothetical protein [Deltaproteobacteria bacterium]MCP4908877.1 TetR/AcrR family transcriptional regulator [bacterium]